MRATCLFLSVLFIVPFVDAAPAPTPGQNAKEKLEALKKRLPAVLDNWVKERLASDKQRLTPVLRRVRATGPAEAKLVVYLHSCDENGEMNAKAFSMLTLFLTYYDGLWTASRFEWDAEDTTKDGIWDTAASFLTDAVDEAAEK